MAFASMTSPQFPVVDLERCSTSMFKLLSEGGHVMSSPSDLGSKDPEARVEPRNLKPQPEQPTWVIGGRPSSNILTGQVRSGQVQVYYSAEV